MKLFFVIKIIFVILIYCSNLTKADDIRIVMLESNDIIYDPLTQKIYASIPSFVIGMGNTITIVDPFTGTIDTSIFIGSEPGKLAISENSQYLYVSLDGAAAIRRFNILSRTAGLQFALGSDPVLGQYYAEDIEVLPGDPEAVAVSLKFLGVSPRFAGVIIYDNGIQRPVRVPGFSGTGEHVNEIEFSSSVSRLYGGSNTSVPTRFYRMSVDSNGVSVIDVTLNIIPGGFSSGEIEFDGGLIYTSQGGLIDPEARVTLGTFILPPGSYLPLVQPDSSEERVHFLTTSSNIGTITTFNNQTFIQIDTLIINGVVNPTSGPSSLIRWGLDGLAFRTSGNQVFLIRSVIIIPVELTSFTANVNNKGDVYLNWSTASELNNQMFEIERKSAEGQYTTIGYVEGFGTTTEPQEYSYIDNAVGTGTYFYRLKQIDFGGQYEYSDEIEVEVNGPLTFALKQNYPNPFNPSTNIKYSVPENGFVKLSVYNLVGEEVRVIVNEMLDAGFYEVTFNAANLPSGTYFYRLQASSFIETKNMILLK